MKSEQQLHLESVFTEDELFNKGYWHAKATASKTAIGMSWPVHNQAFKRGYAKGRLEMLLQKGTTT